jgi:hypothetical protein
VPRWFQCGSSSSNARACLLHGRRELRKGLKLLVELNDMVWATPAHDCKGSDASNSCQDQGPLSRKASHAALCPLHHHHQPGANSSQPLNGGGSSSSMTGPARGEASVVDLVEAGLGPNTPYGTKAAGCPVCAAHETKCEKVLTDVYQSTFKVKDHVGLAANEAYVWHFWGHYFFLPVMFKRVPLVKWCWRGLLGLLGRDEEARWAAIQSDTDEVATCVRRMARLLWMLHLDYTEVRGHEWGGVRHGRGQGHEGWEAPDTCEQGRSNPVHGHLRPAHQSACTVLMRGECSATMKPSSLGGCICVLQHKRTVCQHAMCCVSSALVLSPDAHPHTSTKPHLDKQPPQPMPCCSPLPRASSLSCALPTRPT